MSVDVPSPLPAVVVDDDPSVRKMFSQMLAILDTDLVVEQISFEGSEARQNLGQNLMALDPPFKLLVLDQKDNPLMEDFPGFVRSVRERSGRALILVISGHVLDPNIFEQLLVNEPGIAVLFLKKGEPKIGLAVKYVIDATRRFLAAEGKIDLTTMEQYSSLHFIKGECGQGKFLPTSWLDDTAFCESPQFFEKLEERLGGEVISLHFENGDSGKLDSPRWLEVLKAAYIARIEQVFPGGKDPRKQDVYDFFKIFSSAPVAAFIKEVLKQTEGGRELVDDLLHDIPNVLAPLELRQRVDSEDLHDITNRALILYDAFEDGEFMETVDVAKVVGGFSRLDFCEIEGLDEVRGVLVKTPKAWLRTKISGLIANFEKAAELRDQISSIPFGSSDVPRSRIVFWLSVEGGFVQIQSEDNAPQIPKAAMDDVFDNGITKTAKRHGLGNGHFLRQMARDLATMGGDVALVQRWRDGEITVKGMNGYLDAADWAEPSDWAVKTFHLKLPYVDQ